MPCRTIFSRDWLCVYYEWPLPNLFTFVFWFSNRDLSIDIRCDWRSFAFGLIGVGRFSTLLFGPLRIQIFFPRRIQRKAS